MKVRFLFYGAVVCASLCSFADPPRCSDPQIDANLVLLDRQLQDVISQVDSLAAEYKSYFSRPRLTEMRRNLSNALQTLAKIKCQWGGSKQAYEEQYKNEASGISVGLRATDYGVKRCENRARSEECLTREV